jgi:hypothetical protein
MSMRNRSLAAILAAELVSLTGSAMTYVALPWFVLVTTGSTAKMGWVLAAELLPVGLMTISVLIGPLGFIAVGVALQYVGMSVVFLAIAAGFSAGALAFSAALRRGEEEADAVPAGDLAAVLPVEARAD